MSAAFAGDFGDQPLPWCAVCGKPVEGMTVDIDAMRQTAVVRVRCHGEHETHAVELSKIAEGTKVNDIVAFSGESKP